MHAFDGYEWKSPEKIVLRPDVGVVDYTGSRQVQATLTRDIQTQDQIIWFTDETPTYGQNTLEGSVFEHHDEWAEGRRDSVQGVFFGYLALGEEIETPVAVKPFLSATSAGVHETALLMHLKDRGLPVYEVLGASWSRDQGYTMITKFEEESRSLDNINWQKGVEDPLRDHLTNIDGIKQVGKTLGLLHGNGVIHGDAQIKNFAVNGDEIRVIDLAGARVVGDHADVNETQLGLGMYNDIMLLRDSLSGRGFISDATEEQISTFFDSIVSTSYKAGLFEARGVVEDRIDLRGLVTYVLQKVKLSIKAGD